MKEFKFPLWFFELPANSANPAAIFCQSAVKKPLCDLNFVHIFEILSLKRYEYQCQVLEIIFVVFQGSRNLPWYKVQEISEDFFCLQFLQKIFPISAVKRIHQFCS